MSYPEHGTSQLSRGHWTPTLVKYFSLIITILTTQHNYNIQFSTHQILMTLTLVIHMVIHKMILFSVLMWNYQQLHYRWHFVWLSAWSSYSSHCKPDLTETSWADSSTLSLSSSPQSWSSWYSQSNMSGLGSGTRDLELSSSGSFTGWLCSR